MKYKVFNKWTNELVGEFKTLQEVAKATGSAISTVSYWVSGKRTSKVYRIEKVED